MYFCVWTQSISCSHWIRPNRCSKGDEACLVCGISEEVTSCVIPVWISLCDRLPCTHAFFPSFFCFDHSSPHSSFSPLLFCLNYLKIPFPGSSTLSNTISNSSFFLLLHFLPFSFNIIAGNNRRTRLFVSFLYFFFLSPPSLLSLALLVFEQAATSSQAHLLARANKTEATFPELNLLLRLSSVNWEFSSLKSGGVSWVASGC